MANQYALRIDGTDSTPLITVLKKYGGAWLVVKEQTDGNPHFHAVLHSDAKLAAVRQALKRLLPNSGNGAYSCTAVRDLPKYQKYMMKGDSRDVMPHVVQAEGWNYQDASWQEEMHDAYWETNDEIQAGRKARPVIEVVLEKCKEARTAWTNRQYIAEVYIREMVQRRKAINLFAVKSAVNLLQCQLCPDDRAIEDLAQNV